MIKYQVISVRLSKGIFRTCVVYLYGGRAVTQYARNIRARNSNVLSMTIQIVREAHAQ